MTTNPLHYQANRRSLLAGGLIGTLAALGVSATQAYQARYVLPYQPVLERVSITLPERHGHLAGLRIGFITDTHVGPFITPDDLQRAADLLLAESPDLYLFGGDYISESPRFVGPTVERLSAIAASAPLGGYGVLGNHDLHVAASKVTLAMAESGIHVLRNDATEIVTPRGALWLAGVDETLLGTPDAEHTFAQIPANQAILALWHEPVFAENAAHLGAFAQLSGHTHGGQVRIPFVGTIGLPVHGHRHVIGLNDADGMPVYTSRGVGIYRPPARLNCPPEVTLVTLVAPSQGHPAPN